MLGDAHAEKRSNATRISFSQESSNMEHLIGLWKFFNERGYCSDEKPKIQTRIGYGGKTRYVCRFHSFSYGSFNWIHEAFYKQVNDKNIKFVPKNIPDFLTPQALAIWLMDDGTWQGYGVRIATNSFTKEDVQFLCDVLYSKFNIVATPVINCYTKGKPKTLEYAQYNVYIQADSVKHLRALVRPYFVESMLYKLGE